MKSPSSIRMRSTSTLFRCEKENFTRGKLDALESGKWLFANRKTRTFTGSLSKENNALEKWNRLWQVRQLIIFRFGILFLFSFSDTCVSRLCAAAGSFSHPLFTVLAVVKEPILQGATSWLGRYPRFARLLLQTGEFCATVACCELTGSSACSWQ